MMVTFTLKLFGQFDGFIRFTAAEFLGGGIPLEADVPVTSLDILDFDGLFKGVDENLFPTALAFIGGPFSSSFDLSLLLAFTLMKGRVKAVKLMLF